MKSQKHLHVGEAGWNVVPPPGMVIYGRVGVFFVPTVLKPSHACWYKPRTNGVEEKKVRSKKKIFHFLP